VITETDLAQLPEVTACDAFFTSELIEESWLEGALGELGGHRFMDLSLPGYYDDLPHVLGEEEVWIVTASTEELQEFVRTHADNEDIWNDDYDRFVRKR